MTAVAKRPSGQFAKGSGRRKRAAATVTGTMQPCSGVVGTDSNSEREEQVPPTQLDLRWNAVQRYSQHKSSGDDSDAIDDVIIFQ